MSSTRNDAKRPPDGILRRNTFAFYWSFKDAIRDMSDVDKLAIYEAITDFAFFGIEPEDLTPVARLAWKLIQPQLEASMRRYDACKTNGLKGTKYGQLGGRPCRSTPNTKAPARKPQRITPEDNPKGNPLNHNVNDNDNVNDNEKRGSGGEMTAKRTAFVVPDLETVKEFFLTIRGTETDAEYFFDHFEANGWKVSGKSPMKNWQAAARNWVRRKPEFTYTTTNPKSHETTRKYNDL